MDSGGNMQSNEERGAEKLMDSHLKSLGLHRKKIAKDGSCLFRAVAEQVLHSQSLHTEVRAKCVEFLKQNRDIYEAFIEGDFEDYLLKLQDPQQWVGEVEINALAVMYKRDFVIYQEPGRPAVNITDNNFKDKVQLCFLNGNHYDSVYDCSHIKNAALCQSILYELLYDGVFKADRSFLSLCHRTGRPSDVLSDDNMNFCGSSDESDVDVGQPLWVENETNTQVSRHNRGRGRGRALPERVRRSLNPNLYRNIEYDVWHKTKRAQQKMDYCIAAGMQFTTGDRCQVRLEGRNYNAVIKEASPDNGPVTVYVEELGSRRQVPLWNLRPPSDENSWSTVVNRDKRLSNGHGDWEERGKGRGRGKHVTASPSVSQATAPSSTGHIQKQHSWPMQATVDEHGGAKANRKAVSPVESAFGLTEEQRLAKEEEERNVALVEIQLRDEHSFPALGTQPGLQGDGGKKKPGDKRKSQRNKTKSPVDDIRAPSPSAGERPKSSSPPITAPTVPTANTTTPANPAPPAAKPPAAASVNSDSSSARPSPLEASPPNIKMAGGVDASAAVTSLSSVSTCEAPASKTSGPSYASAAGATQSSPAAAAAAPSTKPSVPPSVPSSASLFSLLPPALPAASSPPTPQAVSSSSPPPSASSKLVPSSSSSLPPKSSASPPPSSSVPPPTFIAPIAPTPAAAQGFLPRSSPPVSSLCHSTSPPSSSSSLIHHAAQVHETPSVSAQSSLKTITQSASQTFQTSASPSQIHPQVPQPQNESRISVTQSQTQSENQAQPSLPPNQTLTPQMQTEASVPESCLPHLQHQPQSHTEVASLSQIQTQPSVLQTSVPQSQAEVAQVQPSHPPAEAPYPNISQASVPVSASVQPQTSVPHPHPHVHLAQPPHPSQVPHPSLSLSASPTHPSLQPQTHHTQDQTEVPPAPTQPQPDSPPHPPHPSHHPYSESAHPPPPPHPPSIPAVVPLQQLSQLYQDPLYPGFPQGEKGAVAHTPAMSCSTSGDDLPKDINILKFFFNLGVKAYSMPMYAPYIYLLPLQHAHAMHPKLPSRSPSPTPHYPPANTPTRHQEAYAHPQYPPTSSSMAPQYNHQAPPTEPSNPSDPSFSQGMYPVTQTATPRMPGSSLPWQQHQIPQPRNPSFQVGYPTPSPPYPVAPPPLCQSYHPGQGQGHPLYRPNVPQYPPSSLGYQTSAAQEELQVSQGSMEQHQPTNGDTMPGRGPIPAAANLAIATNNRAGFAVKNEQGDGLTRTVLLVDPPLNNKPILVSNPGIDVPASMTTMKMSSTTGSSLTYDIISKTTGGGDSNPSRGYRAHPKIPNPTNTYVPLAAPEPGQMGYGMVMAEPLSVGCNTEDDWEEQGFKPATSNYRGMRRGHRGGGRGRGGYDQGRGSFKRRHGGEAVPVPGYVQYNSSYRGRGRDKGY